VAIAVASSLKEVPTRKDDIVFGEIGLAGEVRAVSYAQQRLIEAEKMGFKRCLVSKYNLKGIKPPGDMEVTGVLSIREGIDLILA
jgi:DNA repair protein RadA/Sms